MDINYYILIGIVFFFHWLADFVFQTHEMSINKSKSIKWLTYHIIAYTATWIPFTLVLINKPIDMLWFLSLIFITHWITDFFTSKVTAQLWKEKKIHDFFVMIGFDQFIHAITLLGLIKWFIPIL